MVYRPGLDDMLWCRHRLLAAAFALGRGWGTVHVRITEGAIALIAVDDNLVEEMAMGAVGAGDEGEAAIAHSSVGL